MQSLSAPCRMKSLPLGRRVLSKEVKWDTGQRTFCFEGTAPGEAMVCPARGTPSRRPERARVGKAHLAPGALASGRLVTLNPVGTPDASDPSGVRWHRCPGGTADGVLTPGQRGWPEHHGVGRVWDDLLCVCGLWHRVPSATMPHRGAGEPGRGLAAGVPWVERHGRGPSGQPPRRASAAWEKDRQAGGHLNCRS
jgi:hypothetical protein